MTLSLQRADLHDAYRSGRLGPEDVVAEVHRRIAARGDDAVWIHLVDRDAALAAARDLARRFPGPDLPPLYGLPFAVKDNIDVAGLPTTAACPAFAYDPARTATAVQRALDAGALLIGKTNLDQFATGLSGTRSPYGVVRNPVDPAVIAGGSSSGSAVAVAAGLVTFAFGTDTAGSGRVPAGLTGTVGVKPTKGLVSTVGVVPACRSLDCVSVFALSADDGAAVLACVAGPDPADPWSRALPVPAAAPDAVPLRALRVGVPADLSVEVAFAGDAVAAECFAVALARLEAAGADVVVVDLEPFVQVGALLYRGPWIAERSVALDDFVASHPDDVHPVTRQVLAGATGVSGVDVFRGQHALAAAARATADVWAGVDLLMVPTAPTTPTVDAMLAQPVALNEALGRYTNFVNLLDLAAVAVPSTTTPGGVPVGVTFLAPAGSDGLLLGAAATWQRAVGLPVGATGLALTALEGGGGGEVAAGSGRAGTGPAGAGPAGAGGPAADSVLLAVVGAHLEGQPLHETLLRRGAVLAVRTRTAPGYRLHALAAGAGDPVARPGLVRVAEGGGSVLAEVYRVPVAGLGPILAEVPAPLGIGRVQLADGSTVLGFLAEAVATNGARDITDYGSWPAYLAAGAT